MRNNLIVGILLAATVACSKSDDAAAGLDSSADSTAMANMPGMVAPAGTSVAATVETHLAAMKGVSADSLKAMLPAHRQAAANMIASFNKEMSDMKMAGDVAWNAVIDSLRTDLRRMPDLSAGELQAAMPSHEARLRRLMEMHQAMMKNMKM